MLLQQKTSTILETCNNARLFSANAACFLWVVCGLFTTFLTPWAQTDEAATILNVVSSHDREKTECVKLCAGFRNLCPMFNWPKQLT